MLTQCIESEEFAFCMPCTPCLTFRLLVLFRFEFFLNSVKLLLPELGLLSVFNRL